MNNKKYNINYESANFVLRRLYDRSIFDPVDIKTNPSSVRRLATQYSYY